MDSNHYDAIVIGAGMSGLAAGIRLGMFDKKVLIIEKHTIAGGLNSYYQRRNKEAGGVRQFDVGLHALTNFVKKGERGKPLTKLLKQLRIKYDDLKLKEQNYSSISFPNKKINFKNDFLFFKGEIEKEFPKDFCDFMSLVEHIDGFNETSLDNVYESGKEVVSGFIKNKDLVEMLFAPLLIYGSAWEDDMDFSQFVIMFKSLYYEGFSRPEGGVRTIIDLLLGKYEQTCGELKFRTACEKIIIEDGKVIGIETARGEKLYADKVFSSMGLPETYNRVNPELVTKKPRVGQMTFMESIIVFDKKVSLADFDATIIFHNDSDSYEYKKPSSLYDSRSAVVCCPDNYDLENREGEGTFRITYMANYDLWKNLSKEEYKVAKEKVYQDSLTLVMSLTQNYDGKVLFSDVFSPTTVEKYTWHFNGTVYGSLDKSRDGKTQFENLFIIGTDQGFLGIVGAMLSGISMANLHGLME
jgi:phytoene dehydrogenase-like protein